jgi:hypothetical protein
VGLEVGKIPSPESTDSLREFSGTGAQSQIGKREVWRFGILPNIWRAWHLKKQLQSAP